MAPSYVSLGLAWLLGCVLIIAGISQIIHAFASKAWGGFFLRLLGGVLYLAAGILLEANPLRGALTLTLVLAILLVIQGITRILNAFQCRHISAWGWILVSGVLSTALGISLPYLCGAFL